MSIKPSTMLKWSRIPLVAAATVFPVVCAKQIEDQKPKFLLGFVGLVLLAVVIEMVYDIVIKGELEKDSGRLQLQRVRGLATARLLELLAPLFGLVETQASLDREGKKTAADTAENTVKEILTAVGTEVSRYWNPSGEGKNPAVKVSVMRSYEVATTPPEMLETLKQRVKFMTFKRNLESYKYVLDVELWNERDPLFSAIAVPVEDVADGKNMLLPAAPTAFAMGRDEIICDTHKAKNQAGSDLEPSVLHEQVEYFKSKGIRSIGCLILREPRDKRRKQENLTGILNIHSGQTNVLGKDVHEQALIIGSLEHYRAALEYLLDIQRQLMV